MASQKTKTSTSPAQQTASQSAIDNVLEKFSFYFVSEVETILHAYKLILEGENSEDAIKKLSSICPQTTGELVGYTLGSIIGSFICVPEVGAEIGKIGVKQLAMTLSEKKYLEKTKKIKDLIDSFFQDQAKFRKYLVNTAVDIFQSYERQFINVSTDFGPEKAMQLLAKDAANRCINYFKNDLFSPGLLFKSVLLGKSAKVWGLPFEGRGYQVKSNFNSPDEPWKTESLFNKVGLLKENPSNNSVELFVNIGGDENPEKYGFRRLLSTEKWSDFKDSYVPYTFQKSKQYRSYSFILNFMIAEEKKMTILKNINDKDSNLMEDRIKDMIKEITNDIVEQINTIKNENKNNGECHKVLEIVDEWFRKFSSSFEVCNEIKRDVAIMDQKLDVNHEAILQKLSKIGEAIDDTTKKPKKKSVWFHVKDPVHLFTGRADDLRELHAMMHRSSDRVTVISQMTSISGLGGIGKTETARKYAQLHGEEYDSNVVWINAENKESLVESFTKLATDVLEIKTKNVDGGEKDIKTIVSEVYKCICDEKSLFIFDNVETSKDINDFLPKSLPPTYKKPYVLITSRYREWEKGIEVKNLNELKLEDAMSLVRKGLGIEDGSQEKAIKLLVEKLQSFPLALQQAIAYIIDQQIDGEYSVEDYLEEYQSQARSLLDNNAFQGLDNDYTRTTFTTWKISTDKIASDKIHGDTAIQILETIAYMAPENINRDIFLNLVDNNQRTLKQAVRLLVRYSLLSGKSDQGIFSIHRLVQETMRLKLKDDGKDKERLCNVLMLVNQNLQNDYLDHAMSAWNHTNDYTELVKSFSSLLSKIIDKLRLSARYEEALSFGTKAIDVMNHVLSYQHMDTLTSEDSIAEVVYRQGKYSETLQRYKNMLEKRSRVLGESHPSTLFTQVKIGVVLNNIGDYHEALDICKDVISRKGDCYDADRLAAMHESSRILDHLGNYREAIKGYREVLEHYSKNPNSNPYSVLYTQHGLGRALSNQGEYEESLSVYKTVLEKRNKLFNIDNPDSLSTINNIAVVLNKLGKYDEALELFTDVLEKRSEKIGEDHPSTLYTLHGIAKVLKNKGLLQDASHYFQKVVKKRTDVLGQNAPATLGSRHEFAALLSLQGHHQEALKKLQTIYRTRKELLGESHPSTLSTMHEVAEAMKKCGEEECALNMLQDVHTKRIEVLGDEHPYTLNTRNSIAMILLERGEKERALNMFQDVHEKRMQKLGDNHPSTLLTRHYVNKLLSENIGK